MARHHHVHHIHKKKTKDRYDYLVYFFTLATPMFELTQAVEIYSSKSAVNVAVPMWVFFVISDIVWLGYAVKHKVTTVVCDVHLLPVGRNQHYSRDHSALVESH